MDAPQLDDSTSNAKSPDPLQMRWSPATEADIDKWASTGILPFQEIMLSHPVRVDQYERMDLKLIHSICSIYRDLSHTGVTPFTAWLHIFPILLDIATTHDFVMHALLAFSATQIAHDHKSNEAWKLAYNHRGIALKGLPAAIGNFSQTNSDAVLAASVLMAWQASDWTNWASVIKGTGSVLRTMEPWKDSSLLAAIVENQLVPKSPSRSSLFSGMPTVENSIHDAIAALHKLCAHLKGNHSLLRFANDLLRLAEHISDCTNSMREEQLFNELQRLRAQILWTPVSLLKNGDQGHSDFIALAHLYALALAIDEALPELQGAALGSMCLSALEALDRRIRLSTAPTTMLLSMQIEDLMAFPRETVERAKAVNTLENIALMNNSDFFVPGQGHTHSPGSLSFRQPYAGSQPGTPPSFLPNYHSHGYHSSDDLSVPNSPFLNPYVSTEHRRHSSLYEMHSSSRPDSMAFDRQSFHSAMVNWDSASPIYSPGFNAGFFEHDNSSIHGSISGPSGDAAPNLPAFDFSSPVIKGERVGSPSLGSPSASNANIKRQASDEPNPNFDFESFENFENYDRYGSPSFVSDTQYGSPSPFGRDMLFETPPPQSQPHSQSQQQGQGQGGNTNLKMPVTPVQTQAQVAQVRGVSPAALWRAPPKS